MPTATPLPPINARVDIWFDGYDEYYPGRVDSINPPHDFHVVLDDGTDWDIDIRKHVFKLSEVAVSASDDDRPSHPEPAVNQVSAKPLSADIPEPDPAPPRRRASGRALRKSAVAAPQSKDDDVLDAGREDEPPRARRRSSRVEAAEAEKRAAEPEKRASARLTRSKSGAEESSPVTSPPAPNVSQDRAARAARRTRKRDTVDDEPAAKRRKAERLKDSFKEIADKAVEDEGVEGLSTKAVTAIAVDAALESVKAVLKPLNDQLARLVKQITEISKVATRAAAVAEKAKNPPRATSITAAALENFQLDVSEIIGGGEARIKAYANMSEQEFDGLHRVIEQQGKALQELDRLLYAAQEFGKRAKDADKEKELHREKKGEDGSEGMDVQRAVVAAPPQTPVDSPLKNGAQE